MRTHNIVDTKNAPLTSIEILPNILNQAFLSNNNASIDEELLAEEITKINNKPIHSGPQFKFSEITGLDIKKNCKNYQN